jgi:hypothetical protein
MITKRSNATRRRQDLPDEDDDDEGVGVDVGAACAASHSRNGSAAEPSWVAPKLQISRPCISYTLADLISHFFGPWR